MAQIIVRSGRPDDVETAVSIYERSTFARRNGDWPNRSARVAQVTSNLRNAETTNSWFLIALEGVEAVAMALIHPFRADGGIGEVIPGALLLDLIYVLPERWGMGIGATILDAVIAEAARRGCHRIYLWTHELQNERAHRLYQSRSFTRTGTTAHDAADKPIAEWQRDG